MFSECRHIFATLYTVYENKQLLKELKQAIKLIARNHQTELTIEIKLN